MLLILSLCSIKISAKEVKVFWNSNVLFCSNFNDLNKENKDTANTIYYLTLIEMEWMYIFRKKILFLNLLKEAEYNNILSWFSITGKWCIVHYIVWIYGRFCMRNYHKTVRDNSQLRMGTKTSNCSETSENIWADLLQR